jgi:hypothetical protein
MPLAQMVMADRTEAATSLFSAIRSSIETPQPCSSITICEATAGTENQIGNQGEGRNQDDGLCFCINSNSERDIRFVGTVGRER